MLGSLSWRHEHGVKGSRQRIQAVKANHTLRKERANSTAGSEGKTTIAASLAISAAVAGLKVVLVDADLRHPALSHPRRHNPK